MPNTWCRLHADFADDPKVQMMSEQMQRRLIMLFCSRTKDEVLTEEQMAFKWRITPEEVTETKKLFIAHGFIDKKWNLLNWSKRQFESDMSTPRVKRFRDKKKKSETLHETENETPGTVTVTAPEQNRTEQNRTEDEMLAPEMVAKRVQDLCRISGSRILHVLTEQCRMEMANGSPGLDVVERMVAAREDFNGNFVNFAFTVNAERFFGEMWRDRTSWPWRKDSQQPVTSPKIIFANREGANA